MGVCYLLDGSSEQSVIHLLFYDTSADELRTIRDETYKPYFYAEYPLIAEDETAARSLDAKVRVTEKRDLFTGETRKLTRAELASPSLLRLASKRFSVKWEDRVPYVLGYAYDHNLNFGASYSLEGEKIKTLNEISETLELRFRRRFSGIERKDPQKY
ncbi:MAG: hypothetical protein GTO54_03990, partial [Nitrososphaeria archaeon]|nr:hypothetical protein [Nitrososphaeria archaeon]